MDTINEEMINNAAEEAMEETATDLAESTNDYIDEHPIKSLIIGSVIAGASATGGAILVKGAVKLGKKAVTWVGDKINDRRAKKAKEVKGTDKTVETPVQETTDN